MQAVNIQTTQNVQLEYPLAGIGERLLAYLLDLIIMSSFFFIVILILAAIGLELSLATKVSYFNRHLPVSFCYGEFHLMVKLSVKWHEKK